jgi:hypothetical protein
MALRMARVEPLQADAGWRIFSLLKIVIDDGLGGGPRTDERDADSVAVPRD